MDEPLEPTTGSLGINSDTLPNYNVTFNNKDGEVGRLDFNTDTMKFTGKADESAQRMLDWLAEAFKQRLLQERQQEYQRCLKLVERSLIPQFIWYPKGSTVNANKIGDIYKFQHARTLEELTAKPPK